MHFACICIFIQCIKIKSKLVDDYFAMHLMVHLSLSGTVLKIVLIALHIFILTLKYQCRPTEFFSWFIAISSRWYTESGTL